MSTGDTPLRTITVPQLAAAILAARAAGYESIPRNRPGHGTRGGRAVPTASPAEQRGRATVPSSEIACHK